MKCLECNPIKWTKADVAAIEAELNRPLILPNQTKGDNDE